MPEKPPYKVSPPVQKKLNTDAPKKAIGEQEDLHEDAQKKASKLVKKADLRIPHEETYGFRMKESQAKLDKQKAKKETRKKALSKKEKLHNQLAEQGATKEALLAFESAYDPKMAPQIKQILTDRKLDIREPKDWKTVHELLMTPSKDKPYFCEAYVDAYQKHVPVVPLVALEEEPPVQIADFGQYDLEGENIINVDKGEAVAEVSEKREMKFDEQVLTVENPVNSADDVYAYVEKLPGDLQGDIAVMLDEGDLKNMTLHKLRQVAKYINGIAEARDKKEPLRKLRVALGAEEPSKRDIRIAEKVEGKGLLGIDEADLPQSIFGEEEPKKEKAKIAGGRTREMKK